MPLPRLELFGEVTFLLKVLLGAFGSGLLFPLFSAPRRVQIFIVPVPILVARFRLRRRGALNLLGPRQFTFSLALLLAFLKVFLYSLLLLPFGVEQVVERLAEVRTGGDLCDHSTSPLSDILTP